jgi:hypothetical protein
MAKPWIEAAEEVQNLTRLGDGVADDAEAVGELLQLVAVVEDGEFPLNNIAEFSFKKHGPLQFVVAEQALDVGPHCEGRGLRLVDEIEDTLGDGVVDPIDDATVDLTPLGVAVSDRRRRTNMGNKAGFAENRVEKAAPLAVIGVGEVELDGNVIANVHRLDDGKGSMLQRIKEKIGVTQVRGRRRTWRRERHGAGKNRGGSKSLGSKGN